MVERRALVVGASSGIGRALAVKAAAQGARVVLAARRMALLKDAVDEIRRTGGSATALECDVGDPSQCEAMVGAAVEWLDGLDELYFLSGSSPLVRIQEAGAELWHRLVSVNLVGASLVTADALPALRQSSGTVVVTTHSMGVPWPWLGVYGSIKAGLAEWARALRMEEPYVRVVCISVGNTVSSFADSWDPKTMERALSQWVERGLIRYSVLPTAEMAEGILNAVADPDGPDDLLIAGEAAST